MNKNELFRRCKHAMVHKQSLSMELCQAFVDLIITDECLPLNDETRKYTTLQWWKRMMEMKTKRGELTEGEIEKWDVNKWEMKSL